MYKKDVTYTKIRHLIPTQNVQKRRHLIPTQNVQKRRHLIPTKCTKNT